MRSLAYGLGLFGAIVGALAFVGIGGLAAADGGGYLRIAFLTYGLAGGAAAVAGSILALATRGPRAPTDA